MILANTPPPTLNAATLRTFKELGLSILCLKALWALSSEGESILSPQGTFCFLLPAPLSHRSEIFPQDAGKWVLACGLGRAWSPGCEGGYLPRCSPSWNLFLKADVRHLRRENSTTSSFPLPSPLHP